MDISYHFSQLLQKVIALQNNENPLIGVYSGHPGYSADASKSISSFMGKHVEFFCYENIPDFSKGYDLFIVMAHTMFEQKVIWNIRTASPKTIIAIWTSDNHHREVNNIRTASSADFVFAGHGFCTDYLRTPHSVFMGHLALSCQQWSRDEVMRHINNDCAKAENRSNKMYGGFVAYTIGEERNQLVRDLIDVYPDSHLKLMSLDGRDDYYTKTHEERFNDWASHKTTLILPVTVDLGTRFFDSLTAGQIPVVYSGIEDLPKILTADEMESLPVITFDEMTVSAVKDAHDRAIKAFDKDGDEGVMRRHKYAVDNLMMESRIDSMYKQITGIKVDANTISLEVTDNYVYAGIRK